MASKRISYSVFRNLRNTEYAIVSRIAKAFKGYKLGRLAKTIKVGKGRAHTNTARAPHLDKIG
jgi:hypothetical protein